MMLKNKGGNGDIHPLIHTAEEGFGKTEIKYEGVLNNRRMTGS